jgi:hypothetical protein
MHLGLTQKPPPHLEIVPQRARPSEERFHRGFLGCPSACERDRAIAATRERATLALGEYAVPQPIAVSLEHAAHAIDRSDIDAKAQDHGTHASAVGARR